MVLGNGQQQSGIFKKKHAALAIWRSNLDIAQVLCKVFLVGSWQRYGGTQVPKVNIAAHLPKMKANHLFALERVTISQIFLFKDVIHQ